MAKYPAMLLSLMLLFSCGRAPRTEQLKKDPPLEKLAYSEVLEEEFRKEGFINPSTFRVVIIEPADVSGSDGYAIDTAKKRAYLMLKKHLLSDNRIVTSNVDAALLGIVERDGALKKIDDAKKTRNVYFFEIKKPDIKQHIESLAPKR
jgi:hypothetical protein